MKNLLLIGSLILLSVPAQANVDIRFTNKELDAAFVLMRPELNSIELNGQGGVFEPAPSLKFLGVDRQKFEIDMGWIANIADLSFNHLKAKMPQVRFQSGTFQIVVPVEDQSKAIQSRLGSISFKSVFLTATLGWTTRADGRQELSVISTRFDGQMSGSGVLRSSLILRKTRELLMKLLTNSVKNLVNKPTVQEGIRSGLLTWAKFYTGSEYHDVKPGSLQFFSETQSNGMTYQVQ